MSWAEFNTAHLYWLTLWATCKQQVNLDGPELVVPRIDENALRLLHIRMQRDRRPT